MTAVQALPLTLLALATLMVGMSASIAVRRLIRDRRTARRELRLARVRPLLLRQLSDDEPNLAVLDGIIGPEGKLLEELAWQMLTKVRGASRAAIVEWLGSRGAIEDARSRTHRWGAAGRANAAERLGAAGVAATSPDVARLLHDQHAEVRIVAARALGKLGDEKAVPQLLDALSGDKAIPMGVVSIALLHIGPTVIEPLLEGLHHDDAAVRAVCADLVGMHGALSGTRPLIRLVESDEVLDVRLRAAAALGRIGAPQGVEPLTRALTQSNVAVLRVAAAGALGQIGGAGALSALHNAANDPDEALGGAAAAALAKLGPKGAEVLTAMSEGEGPARERANYWLARSQVDAGRTGRRRGRAAMPPGSGS